MEKETQSKNPDKIRMYSQNGKSYIPSPLIYYLAGFNESIYVGTFVALNPKSSKNLLIKVV